MVPHCMASPHTLHTCPHSLNRATVSFLSGQKTGSWVRASW